MYIIAVYDVHHKRVGKVRKVFKKYLFTVQNSVFEGYITESKLNKLKRDLDKVIDVSYDSICFYELESLKYISKEQIGMVKNHSNLIWKEEWYEI